MRVRLALVIAVLGLMAAPAAASADFVHVVGPGESLSSIAAADGLSVGELAAANGLAPDAQLISGMDLQIPPVSGGGAAPTGAATATATIRRRRPPRAPMATATPMTSRPAPHPPPRPPPPVRPRAPMWLRRGTR